MKFTADVTPLQRYCFIEVRAGLVSYTRIHDDHQYHAGDVLLTAQPDAPFTAFVEGSAFVAALVDSEVIDQVASVGPRRLEPARFTGYNPVSASAARTWRSTYAHLTDDLTANPEVLSHPLVTGNAARMPAANSLSTFPNNALIDLTIEDRHDAHPRTLRWAIAFIDGYADQDISVADIAQASEVTIRAVQLAFGRNLDSTPLAYLRRVRLDAARADLRAGARVRTRSPRSPHDGASPGQASSRPATARPTANFRHARCATPDRPPITFAPPSPIVHARCQRRDPRAGVADLSCRGQEAARSSRWSRAPR